MVASQFRRVQGGGAVSTLEGILVTPQDANSGKFVEVIPALDLVNSNFNVSADTVWLKNLGTSVNLTWSMFWHDGGYCLRLNRDVAEGIARAVMAEKKHDAPEPPATSRGES